MESYTSQEDAIYAKATERGISHNAIYDYFDQIIDRIMEQHPGKRADWRLGRAESFVWERFCECSCHLYVFHCLHRRTQDACHFE